MMNTENLAVRLSVGSFFVAIFSLGWNVYRHCVNRPIIKVCFEEDELFGALVMRVINKGAVNVKIIRCVAFRRKLFSCRRRQGGVKHFSEMENSNYDRLPKTVGYDDDCKLLIDINKIDELLPGDGRMYVGIEDVRGKFHFARYE